MWSIRIHVRIKTVFVRRLYIPSCRRFIRHQRNLYNRLNTLETILPWHDQPDRRSVLRRRRLRHRQRVRDDARARTLEDEGRQPRGQTRQDESEDDETTSPGSHSKSLDAQTAARAAAKKRRKALSNRPAASLRARRAPRIRRFRLATNLVSAPALTVNAILRARG